MALKLTEEALSLCTCPLLTRSDQVMLQAVTTCPALSDLETSGGGRGETQSWSEWKHHLQNKTTKNSCENTQAYSLGCVTSSSEVYEGTMYVSFIVSVRSICGVFSSG